MSDEFTQHIFEIIISKVAQECGFTSTSESALEILTDVVIDRITQYVRRAAQLTAVCGRTDTNGIDVFEALSFFNESPETLTTFINSLNSNNPNDINTRPILSQFEYLVEPYPLPRLPKFYTTTNQSNQQQKVIIPHRANLCFFTENNVGQQQSQQQQSIPPFFPSMPSRHTYDSVIAPDPNVDDKEMLKKHEADQNQIKQSLAHILTTKGNDQPQSVHIDCELTSLTQNNNVISKPTDMIDSPIYKVEGIRPNADPEFLPLLEVTENTFISEAQNNKDIQYMATILAIPQGENEPSSIKKSPLFRESGQDKTSDKSTEKSSSPSSP